MSKLQSFSSTLLEWHSHQDRYLPWKEDNNVFYIWLSEIILQQTRVEQGIPYYLKFRQRFKSVIDLANCSDEELMKLWQGLGYYSRARNLHAAAKQIKEQGGQFPTTYEGLLELKGVGPYTAAAIASFAYNLPVPVQDGNVNRVIARIFGITEAIDTKEGRAQIQTCLEGVFDKGNPATFNQAIMDFGALQCKPKSPVCKVCPFISQCIAFQDEMVDNIPFKAKRIKKTNRSLHYLICKRKDKYVIRKRTGKGIWRHLHDFVLIENKTLDQETISATLDDLGISDYEMIEKKGPFKHVLTHQNLQVYFHHIDAQQVNLKKGSDYFLVDRKNLVKFAFPKIIDWYLKEKSIY